jgi:hypothetical protein
MISKKTLGQYFFPLKGEKYFIDNPINSLCGKMFEPKTKLSVENDFLSLGN